MQSGWSSGAIFCCSFGTAANPCFVPCVPPDTSVAVENLTVILNELAQGDAQAADRLLPLVYAELRKLAAAKMARETAAHTLQPTALVHEAWLRLGGAEQPDWKNRAHFFASAAEAMRRILIERARRNGRERHGGGLQRVDVDDPVHGIAAPGSDDELLAVHEALDRLAAHDARKAELVKLRYFVGLAIEQAAEVLGVAAPTAKRDWTYARAWLYKEISPNR